MKKAQSNVNYADGTAYGVDGCKAGWFCIALEPYGTIRGLVVQTLDELVTMASDGDRILVDIPIGLSDGPEERLCDREARRRLGAPRGSSVFRTPARSALGAKNYEEAKRISRTVTGKSLSIQSWAIMPKIREADTLLRGCGKARGMIREVHPEVCFWALAGERSMTHNKKKSEGIDERIAVLEHILPSAGQAFDRICNDFPRSIVAKDDILDAMVAAITASTDLRQLRALAEWPSRDAHGLPMEMVYCPKSALSAHRP